VALIENTHRSNGEGRCMPSLFCYKKGQHTSCTHLIQMLTKSYIVDYYLSKYSDGCSSLEKTKLTTVAWTNKLTKAKCSQENKLCNNSSKSTSSSTITFFVMF
jgi:hypothetical protein